jgi:hypothetical protein
MELAGLMDHCPSPHREGEMSLALQTAGCPRGIGKDMERALDKKGLYFSSGVWEDLNAKRGFKKQ